MVTWLWGIEKENLDDRWKELLPSLFSEEVSLPQQRHFNLSSQCISRLPPLLPFPPEEEDQAVSGPCFTSICHFPAKAGPWLAARLDWAAWGGWATQMLALGGTQLVEAVVEQGGVLAVCPVSSAIRMPGIRCPLPLWLVQRHLRGAWGCVECFKAAWCYDFGVGGW